MTNKSRGKGAAKRGAAKRGTRARRREHMSEVVSMVASGAMDGGPVVGVLGSEIPPAGDRRRAWIRFQLQQHENAKAGRAYNQADISRMADTSEGTVSNVFLGTGRLKGDKAAAVRKITSEILGIAEETLFPEAFAANSPNVTCPHCACTFDAATRSIVTPGAVLAPVAEVIS